MEKEKKGIRCSYAVLVIILFAALAFVTDYAIIERKTRTCNCPKCSVSENTTNDSKGYVGEYTYSNVDQETGIEIEKVLALSSDGTFYIEELSTSKQYFYGTYEVSDNKIVLNYMFRWGNDEGNYNRINNEKSELSIKDSVISGSIDYRSNDIINTYTKTSDSVSLSKDFINDIVNTYGL